jgi:hypothetical protein
LGYGSFIAAPTTSASLHTMVSCPFDIATPI